MKKEVKPCECGANRWKTIKKNNKYQCRKCGKIRDISSNPPQSAL